MEMKNAYKILNAEPEGNRPLRSPGHRWEDNIKRGIDWEGVDWIHLTQDKGQWQAFGNMIMNHRVP
jgi:hypothetical protein